MADELLLSDRDLFEQGAAGIVSALVLVVANAGAPQPVQAAIAAVSPLLGLGLGRGLYRATQRRYPRFAQGFLNAFDRDPAKAREKVKEAAENDVTESLDEIMMRSFRQMMDAVDESVVPVIGYMAGRYAFERKKPDAFFRGLGRLLCELEAGELDQLIRILKLAMLPGKYSGAIVHLAYDGAVQAFREKVETESGVPSALRIFALLKREGFGSQYVPDAEDESNTYTPEEWVCLDEPALGKLSCILMP